MIYVNLWLHFRILILVSCDRAVKEWLGVAELGEDVLDPVDGGECGPGHGLEHRAEGKPGLEPMNVLAPLLEVDQHCLESLGGSEVCVDNVVTINHDGQFRASLKVSKFKLINASDVKHVSLPLWR